MEYEQWTNHSILRLLQGRCREIEFEAMLFNPPTPMARIQILPKLVDQIMDVVRSLREREPKLDMVAAIRQYLGRRNQPEGEVQKGRRE